MKTFVIALPALLLAVVLSAQVQEPSWKLSLRTELPQAKVLGFGGPYDVSGSRIHVPVTPAMADAFEAAPHSEVVAFLQQLAADEVFQAEKRYISMCVRALSEDEKPTRSQWKYADGHEIAVVYYHIPFPKLPKKEKMPIQPPQTTTGSSAPDRV